MKLYPIPFLALFIILLSPCKGMAQMSLMEGKEGEILQSPICSKLVNRSDQTILGTLMTAKQQVASGEVVEHSDNFRLNAGAEQEFCVAGPFFEGRRIKIVLRTLIPLFECKTKIDKPVYLDAQPDENGFKKLSADCS